MIESKINKRIIKTIFGQNENDIEKIIEKPNTTNEINDENWKSFKKNTIWSFIKSGIKKMKKEIL